MTIPDPVVAPVMAELVACLTAALVDVPNPPGPPDAEPRVACLRPGDRVDLLIAQDVDECCAGLAWVRWVGLVPSAVKFPNPDETMRPCDVTRWAVTVELGAVRCAPTPDMETVPTCDEWDAVTIGCYDDLAAIRRALCCYTTAHPYDRLVLQGAAVPLTTEGGCVGVAMLATISAPACDC